MQDRWQVSWVRGLKPFRRGMWRSFLAKEQKLADVVPVFREISFSQSMLMWDLFFAKNLLRGNLVTWFLSFTEFVFAETS